MGLVLIIDVLSCVFSFKGCLILRDLLGWFMGGFFSISWLGGSSGLGNLVGGFALQWWELGGSHYHTLDQKFGSLARAMEDWLVLWNTFYDFPETVGNLIIPTDFHSIIFQRGRVETTNPRKMVCSVPSVSIPWWHGVTSARPEMRHARRWKFTDSSMCRCAVETHEDQYFFFCG